MNREVLYEAITNIDNRFIEEADPEAGSGYMPRIRRLRPVLNTAAVLLVVFGLTTVAVRSGLLSGAKSEAPAAADAPAAETPMAAQFALKTETAYDVAVPESIEAEEAVLEDAMEEPVPEPAAGEAPAGEFHAEADMRGSDDMTDRLTLEGINADAGELLKSYPTEIIWKNASYTLCEELLSELPEYAVSSGVVENTEGSVFFAASDTVLGMQVFVSADSECLYISVGDFWAVYSK